MHGYLEIYPWTIGTRTGFMDKIVVSYDTQELRERCFLVDESLYKGHLAWPLLMYTFCNSMCIHQFLESLQLTLYMFEDIFCWHTYLVQILEVLVFPKIGNLVNTCVKCHQRRIQEERQSGDREDVHHGQESRGG